MQLHATPEDSATRRHRPKTLTVFAAAFAAGAVLAYGVNRVVDVHVIQVEPQVESEPIFVALRSLPQGAPVTIWDVALKDWPKAMLPTTALKADASFDGMVLRHPIREGQPLLSVQLVRDVASPPATALAALPSPAVERFVPAAPAAPTAVASPPVDPPVTAAPEPAPATAASVGEPTSRAATAAATPAAANDPTVATVAVADPDIEADTEARMEARVEVAPRIDAGGTPAVGTAPAVVTAVEPVEGGIPARGDWIASVGAEPTLATDADAAPSVTAADALQAFAAPVPTLPSTDLGFSLAEIGRSGRQQATGDASVLDRSAELQPPAAERPSPRHHLVIPERIALAVDASFTQPPQPVTGPDDAPQVVPPSRSTAATPGDNTSANPAAATGAPSRAATRRPTTATNPSARKPAAASRQPAANPARKPQSATPRGLSAWFPQWSGGSTRR